MYSTHGFRMIETKWFGQALRNDPTLCLNDELFLMIFSFLNAQQLGVCSLVNRRWKALSEDKDLPVNQNSVLAAPELFFKTIAKAEPDVTDWVSGDKPMAKILHASREQTKVMDRANFLTVVRNDATPRLTSVVSYSDRWIITKDYVSQYQFDIEGKTCSFSINVAPSSYGMKKADYCLPAMKYFLFYGENHLLVIGNTGVFQIWDLLSEDMTVSLDLQTKFRAKKNEIKEVYRVDHWAILKIAAYRKEGLDYVVDETTYRTFNLHTFKFTKNHVTDRLEDQTHYSRNQIVLSNPCQSIVAYKIDKLGVLQLKWFRECKAIGKYDSLDVLALNTRWVVLKEANPKKKSGDLIVLDAQSGGLIGSPLSVALWGQDKLWLFNNFMAYQRMNRRSLTILHLPSFKTYKIKSTKRGLLDKQRTEIQDVALFDERLSILQSCDTEFRLVSYSLGND